MVLLPIVSIDNEQGSQIGPLTEIWNPGRTWKVERDRSEIRTALCARVALEVGPRVKNGRCYM